MEDRWLRFKRQQDAERRFQNLLARFDRLKDIDPRSFMRCFYEGDILKGFHKLGKLIFKEMLYEAYRQTLGRNRSLSKPIFLIGLPHSGTTIAMRMLALHPMITNSSELNLYWHPVDSLDLKHCDHEKKAIDCNGKEVRRIRSRLEFERWFRGNKPRFMNKNPNNTVAVEYIKACFPDSFIVHVVRDGRAVVNSLMHSLPDEVETYDRYKPPQERVNPWAGVRPPDWGKWLNNDPIVQHAHQWRLCINYVIERKSMLLPNFRELRYEDLCEDTRKCVSEVWEAAGLTVTEEILEKVPEKLESKNFKYRTALSPTDIENIEEIAGDSLAQFGYI